MKQYIPLILFPKLGLKSKYWKINHHKYKKTLEMNYTPTFIELTFITFNKTQNKSSQPQVQRTQFHLTFQVSSSKNSKDSLIQDKNAVANRDI